MQPTDRRLANAIRALAMDAVEAANSGHPGMPMRMADAATALFTRHLKFDAADPHWPDRDRVILSAGHGSMLIYAVLYLTGYERPTLDDIKRFRQLGSPTAGHPENFELPGIEVTTGPLGQGVAMAVGMAVAERHLNAVYGDELVDHRTFVVAGDGCRMEGVNHEAVGLAGHLRLGGIDHALWKERLEESGRKDEFLARLNGKVTDAWLKPYLDKLFKDELKPVATRKASEMALEAINAALPATIGGSADLTGSNNTKTKALEPLTADNYAGRYIYYGIREFGMAAAMNGMALHGGIIPHGGTFLVFTDYARPAIRLSALQNANVIYVKTTASIVLREDDPTHQPIEHLQSLRAMPQLDVYRPADAVETAECWALALQSDGPSILALTRQNLPPVRTEASSENLCARGAYRLKPAKNARQVILIATGSEVEIALGAAEQLEAQGIGADVVSMPCTERFDAQPRDYRDAVLPDDPPLLRVSIEAGTTFGWERYTGLNGIRIGIDRFGVSAPANDAYEFFGLTPDAVAARVLERVKQREMA